MTIQTNELLEKALDLPPAERAALASRLLASIEEESDASLHPSWPKEIQNRLHAIDAGKVAMITEEEAFRRIFHEK